MTKFKSIINKSYYGIIAYIEDDTSIDELEATIKHNLDVFKEFKNIIVATNFNSHNLVSIYELAWKKYFPDCIFLHNEFNRGHGFGTADLDISIFDYCKNNNIKWLCKGAGDVLLYPELLDIEIETADFYYINAIGKGGIEKYNSDFDRIIEEDFFPQTNFYAIDVSKCDYLSDKKELDSQYQKSQNHPFPYSDLTQPPIQFCWEGDLAGCIDRNNLTKQHLVSKKYYRELLKFIEEYDVHDPSHKNIWVEGVCHYHIFGKPIYKLGGNA